MSKRNWCWCDQFAEEKQQKLEEKAAEDQTENEVEYHVDEAMELQDQRTRFRMVKTCHKKISNIKQTSSQRTWPRIDRRSHIGESDRWVDSRSRAAIRSAHM